MKKCGEKNKMNKYEKVVLLTMNRIEAYNEMPEIAWENASIEIFGAKTSSQKKCCPKNSFLGLCEEGMIKGVFQGKYCKKNNSVNKNYVIKALDLICKDKSLIKDKIGLWKKITKIKYNQQLDVLFILIENGYIVLD